MVSNPSFRATDNQPLRPSEVMCEHSERLAISCSFSTISFDHFEKEPRFPIKLTIRSVRRFGKRMNS